MSGRRGWAMVVAVLVLGAGLVLGPAGVARAGGPTSVLLVVPGSGRIGALYYDNPDYQTLTELVGAYEPAAGSTQAPPGGSDSGASGTLLDTDPGVTLTWLMHDVAVWRVDRVYVTAKGGPWISTQGDLDTGGLSDEPRWHRSKDGAALVALLTRLHLTVDSPPPVTASPAGSGAGSGQPSPSPAAAEPVSAPVARANASIPEPAAAGSAGSAPSSLDAWTAGVGGVVLGVGLTIGWVAYRRSNITVS